MKVLRSIAPVLVMLVALAATACYDAPPEVSATELIHIHRLQAAPEGGLYVATHVGLYTVDDEGNIRAVGDATHDLMGFTVAGSDDLLASGHPDLRDDSLQVEGKPPLLGLVASDDGEDWEPMSLLGDVDFHSLVSAHGNVYGVDSQTGALMVSEDRRTWDTRSSSVPFTDIAVDPADPDLLVGASPAGVERSSDGGRTWKSVAEERLVYLAWVKSGLYGVSPEGALMVSSDDGGTWETRGNASGEPHALLVTDESVFIANERGIFRSDDGGDSFSTFVATASS